MGCRSDYQEPNAREIENSKVLALIKELKTGQDPRKNDFGTGMGESYNKTTQEVLDKNTKQLCSLLQKKTEVEIKTMSLEMQTWWRNHQEVDKRHIEEELESKKSEKAKKEALKKLTPYERKVLGY